VRPNAYTDGLAAIALLIAVFCALQLAVPARWTGAEVQRDATLAAAGWPAMEEGG
jgi:hypothetical protein